MNGKQLIEKLSSLLEELDISKDEFYWINYSTSDQERLFQELGKFKCVFDERAIGDGDYDSWTKVFFFEDHSVHIAQDASYDSWNGADASGSDFVEVEPQEVTRIEYVRK